MNIFQDLLSAWDGYKALTTPPAQPVKLWGDESRGIWISDTWGPAVPYAAIDHRNGERNYGYVRAKDNLSLIGSIPEVQGWPELQRFLEVINSDESPIESVGCEKGYFQPDSEELPPVQLGSYVDVIFTDAALNDKPENALSIAALLAESVQGCEKWWANVEFFLQRMRVLAGADMPWGLMLRITNYGRTQEEARRFWGETLLRLGEAIATLPRNFGHAA